MLITISRQFASGSSAIGARVAGALGWRVIDNELIDQVAERAGMSREDVARLEERAPSFVERLARMAAMELPEGFMPTPAVIEGYEEAKLVKITQKVVTELAASGRVVFIGRAAAAVLAQQADALHLRLVASKPFRQQRASELLRLTPAAALQRLDEVDRNRERYHREYYDRDWEDPTSYHLILNTERLGLDAAADLIVDQVRRLGWS